MPDRPEKPYPGTSTLEYVSGLAALPASLKDGIWPVVEVVASALLVVVLVWVF